MNSKFAWPTLPWDKNRERRERENGTINGEQMSRFVNKKKKKKKGFFRHDRQPTRRKKST